MSHDETTPPPPDAPRAAPDPRAHDAAALPTGAEPPPRGVTLMAIVRWAILLAVTALAAVTLWSTWGPGAHEAARGEPRYYCPMHPEITSPTPGECPICHMNLEPIPADRTQRVTGPMGAALHAHDAGAVHTDGGAAIAAPVDDAGVVEGVTPVVLTLERQQAVGVSTTAARVAAGAQSARAPAVVEAPQDATAQVHVRAPGFIERIAVSETGVRVGRGQTLAWYYSPQIYQAQQEFLTAHRWAMRDAPAGATARGDAGSGLGTAATPALERASRANLELLGMTPRDIDELARRDAPMRAVPIRAPASGFVTQRAAVLGAYVAPETTLYELAGLSRVWVVASVFSADLPYIRRGTAARFVPNGARPTDPPVTARVELIEPEIAAATRTARVRLEVGNAGMRLRPGQYGEVHFDLPAGARPLLVVPRDAVVDTGTQQYVFVDRGEGYFEPRRVRVGALRDGELEVTAGLAAGERVVSRGAFLLDSESRLQAAVAGANTVDGGGAPTSAPDAGGAP